MEIMNENKVWTAVTMTVNTGNYENVKIDMGQSMTIGPDDDPAELRMNLMRNILKDLMAESLKVKGKEYMPKGEATETQGRRRRF